MNLPITRNRHIDDPIDWLATIYDDDEEIVDIIERAAAQMRAMTEETE